MFGKCRNRRSELGLEGHHNGWLLFDGVLNLYRMVRKRRRKDKEQLLETTLEVSRVSVAEDVFRCIPGGDGGIVEAGWNSGACCGWVQAWVKCKSRLSETREGHSSTSPFAALNGS